MKEINEMSLKELFEVQQQLGKAIEERGRMGQDIRKRREMRKSHPLNLTLVSEEKKGTKKLSVDEIERKMNAVVDLFGITDERFRWYCVGLIDGYKVHHDRQMKGEKSVKLKGIDFFKAGLRGVTIKGGDALVLLGELRDGRSTTQVIPWGAIIEVKAEPYCPVVTTVSKKKRKRAIEHRVDEVIKARELKRQKEKIDLPVNEIRSFDDTFSVRLREDGCIDVIEHIVDECKINALLGRIIKAKERQKEKIEVSWIDLDTGEVEIKKMTFDEYKKEIG